MASFDRSSSSLFASTSGSPSSSSIPLNPFSISPNAWLVAEQRTQEILSQIEPTVQSQQCRRSIVQYLDSLLITHLGVKIFPFGSVPLRTYLPDGDIDVTAVSSHTVEEALVKNVRALLEAQELAPDGFEVTDVHFIDAEVKLIKCLVQNIVVDISFNQFGGLGTLCFFEEVDRIIGRDHLFKRSVILIKAWSYHESRILGAHHGLLSTYALETLVLYIFQLFHASLGGPLSVLYRFLDYFSKFDWDNYCVSLSGPDSISCLPQTMGTMPQNDVGELLLSKEFLKTCVETLSVPPREHDTSSRPFLQKHLNIVDPLRENNNLGRSVSQGNYVRIRLAFTYGARKLSQILLQPGGGRIVHELNNFFKNTLDRHVIGQRRDVQDSLPAYVAKVLKIASQKTWVDGMRISGNGTGDGVLGLRPTAYTWEDMYVGYDGCELGAGPGEALSTLPDLGENYDSHLQSLQFVQEYSDASSGELPQSLPSQIQSILSSYPMNQQPPPTTSDAASGLVEVPSPSQLGPSPIGTGRNLTSVALGTSSSQIPPRSSSGPMTNQDTEKESSKDELLEEEFPALPSLARLHPVASIQTASRPLMEEAKNEGALSMPQPDKLDIESSPGHLPYLASPSSEEGASSESDASNVTTSVSVQTYKLKDDEDFPPLNLVGRKIVHSRPPMEEAKNVGALSMPQPDKLDIESSPGHLPSLASPSSDEEHASSELDASNVTTSVSVQTYKLEDDEDFPPLNLAGKKIVHR